MAEQLSSILKKLKDAHDSGILTDEEYLKKLKQLQKAANEAKQRQAARRAQTPPAQAAPAESYAEPVQAAPAGYYTEPAQAAPAGYYTEPAQPDPAGYYTEPAQAAPAGYYTEPAQPDPAGYYTEPAQAAPAGYYTEPAQAVPAGYYTEPVQAAPAGYYNEPAQPDPYADAGYGQPAQADPYGEEQENVETIDFLEAVNEADDQSDYAQPEYPGQTPEYTADQAAYPAEAAEYAGQTPEYTGFSPAQPDAVQDIPAETGYEEGYDPYAAPAEYLPQDGTDVFEAPQDLPEVPDAAYAEEVSDAYLDIDSEAPTVFFDENAAPAAETAAAETAEMLPAAAFSGAEPENGEAEGRIIWPEEREAMEAAGKKRGIGGFLQGSKKKKIIIIAAAVVLLAAIGYFLFGYMGLGSGMSDDADTETAEFQGWPDNAAGKMIPQPEGTVTDAYADADDMLDVYVTCTQDQFRQYVEACKNAGFTENLEEGSEDEIESFYAENGNGYGLYVDFYGDEMTVSLAPAEDYSVEEDEGAENEIDSEDEAIVNEGDVGD